MSYQVSSFAEHLVKCCYDFPLKYKIFIIKKLQNIASLTLYKADPNPDKYTFKKLRYFKSRITLNILLGTDM